MPDRQDAVSFCDFSFPVFNWKSWEEKLGDAKRVYIGSYFCEGLFIRYGAFDFVAFTEFLRANNAKGTLVVPICRQGELEAAKYVVSQAALHAEIDEIVVNDVGMLDYVSRDFGQKKRLLGRLFFKNTRDSRSVFPRLGEEISYYAPVYESLFKEYGFSGIEADTASLTMNFEGIPESVILGIHTPWTYMTCGRMCAFAGAGLPDDKKFVADAPCRMECMGNPVYYSHQQGLIVKSGKAVYCPALPVDINGAGCIRHIKSVTEWEQSDGK